MQEKILGELIFAPIHAGPVFAPAPIQENIFEELFSSYFPICGGSSCRCKYMPRLYSHPREYRKIFLGNNLCIGFVPGGISTVIVNYNIVVFLVRPGPLGLGRSAQSWGHCLLLVWLHLVPVLHGEEGPGLLQRVARWRPRQRAKLCRRASEDWGQCWRAWGCWAECAVYAHKSPFFTCCFPHLPVVNQFLRFWKRLRPALRNLIL